MTKRQRTNVKPTSFSKYKSDLTPIPKTMLKKIKKTLKKLVPSWKTKKTEQSMIQRNTPIAREEVVLATFHKFNDLPRELRDMIFYFALLGARIIYACVSYWHHPNIADFTLPSNPLLSTPLLHTSREARQLTRRYYVIENVFLHRHRATYIDLEVDFVHFYTDAFPDELSAPYNWVRNIRNIALNWGSIWRENHYEHPKCNITFIGQGDLERALDRLSRGIETDVLAHIELAR